MKETIATIPLMNAFHADDECPFCYLEREAEQHAISFILGSAYMEDDIRAKTDATGFCRHHFKICLLYTSGSLSAADIFTYLYFEELNIDPKNPKMADRDRFVLSKGHTAPGLYAALAERGFFPKEDLVTDVYKRQE